MLENIDSRPNKRFKPIKWSELHQLPKREYLIKHLLDRSGTSVIYGESNCGKTFIALDLALHIVKAKPWHNHKVYSSAVVYVATEGGLGLQERLEAFRLHNNCNEDGEFYLITASIDLCSSPKDAKELVQEIRSIPNVGLIVIDTLSRAMAGGNENSPDDMGRFIRICDYIKQETRSHILIIHHAGKDPSRGARGHSALRAAVDSEFEVTKIDNGFISLEVKKQRDTRTGDIYYFDLLPIKIGKDEDGIDIHSCVLSCAQEPPAQKKRLSKQKKRAVEAIREAMIDHGRMVAPKKAMAPIRCITLSEAREALIRCNISAADQPDDIRRSIARVLKELCDAGITATYNEFIWFPDNPDE